MRKTMESSIAAAAANAFQAALLVHVRPWVNAEPL
jgi:hypothetical protein